MGSSNSKRYTNNELRAEPYVERSPKRKGLSSEEIDKITTNRVFGDYFINKENLELILSDDKFIGLYKKYYIEEKKLLKYPELLKIVDKLYSNGFGYCDVTTNNAMRVYHKMPIGTFKETKIDIADEYLGESSGYNYERIYHNCQVVIVCDSKTHKYLTDLETECIKRIKEENRMRISDLLGTTSTEPSAPEELEGS